MPQANGEIAREQTMNIVPNPHAKRNDLQSEEDFIITEAEARDVVKKGNKWCVISEQTGKSFGCYKTKKEANKRLRQIKGHGSK